jgi:CheY-like chemotaxis protein
VTDEVKVADFNGKYIEMWRVPQEVLKRGIARELRGLMSQNFAEPQRFLGRIKEITATSEESFDLLDLKDGRIIERYSKVLIIESQTAGRVWNYRDVTDRHLAEITSRHLAAIVASSDDAGIRPEFMPFVFDRFRQADASTTRRHGGLGLSIVRQLVELHGGSVRVKSDGLGHGSTFVVSLPLTEVQACPEPESERPHPRIAHTGAPDVEVEIRGVRVLVVDDESAARALLKRILEDCHAIVTTVESSGEAVILLQDGPFDVLVCDIGMPGENGYSLIKRVRSLGTANGGDIPAIALTAYARVEDRVRAIAAGFQMHIAKPIEPVELITMVYRVIRTRPYSTYQL